MCELGNGKQKWGRELSQAKTGELNAPVSWPNISGIESLSICDRESMCRTSEGNSRISRNSPGHWDSPFPLIFQCVPKGLVFTQNPSSHAEPWLNCKIGWVIILIEKYIFTWNKLLFLNYSYVTQIVWFIFEQKMFNIQPGNSYLAQITISSILISTSSIYIFLLSLPCPLPFLSPSKFTYISQGIYVV